MIFSIQYPVNTKRGFPDDTFILFQLSTQRRTQQSIGGELLITQNLKLVGPIGRGDDDKNRTGFGL